MTKPSVVLEKNRELIRQIISKYRVTNPRIFGSVIHGEDDENSDLDILIDRLPGATLFDLGELKYDLEINLGINIDIITPNSLSIKFRNQVLEEAQPL